jgi:PAS domain S-box-containing protein
MTELTKQTPTTENTIPEANGKLQNRITLLLVVILIPILIVYAWFDIKNQQRNLEALLLERAEATATAGASTISSFLEQAINNGELTREEAFDTDYQQFWEFDPTAHPDFEGDPATLAKYHTAYDTYTDEQWQGLIDSFLGGGDMIFAVAADINGYVPTHNSRWTSGDGSPATDRTKRIFNDPVGIQAVQNTEPIIQQVYQQAGTGDTLWDVSAPIYVDGEHWGAFRVGMALAQNQERVIAATWQTVLGISLVVILVSIFSLVVGRYVSAPIVELTGVATQIAGGNLKQQVDLPNRQEITTLAQVFNLMTQQLRNVLENLEQRVAARTQDLNLAAEIGREITQERDLNKLLPQAAQLVLDQFNLYQTQIYLVDRTGENLVLRASTGFAGSQLLEAGHQLPIDQNSLNGTAVYEKHAIIVSDTQASDIFMPHPLLPDTRSEMVVPLIVDEQVVGVLDLQSRQTNAFSEDNLAAFEVLTGQIAIAILNARQNEEIRRSQEAMRANEALLRTIIDSTPDWIFVKDTNHRYQLVNQGYANSIGIAPDSFIGKDDLELGFPEEIVKGDPEKGILGFWGGDREIMASGEIKIIDEEPAVVNGEPRTLNTIKVPLKDAHGVVTGVVGFVHDITDLKNAQALLQKEQERIITILESISIPVVVSRIADGQVLYLNDPMADAIRTARESLVGKATPDFYSNPQERAAYLEVLTPGWLCA